jgi:DNA repair photolyase
MLKGENLKLKAVDVKRIEELVSGKRPNDPLWKYFFSKRYIMQWGSMADPFCNFEKKNRIGEHLIKIFGDLKYPIRFSFKGQEVETYLPLFDKYKEAKNFAFQSSIIGLDNELASKIEVGVPTPAFRFKMLGELGAMGYWTILRLRPFVVGFSDRDLDGLLENCKKYNIKGISLEFFALDLKCSKEVRKQVTRLGDILGYDIEQYYKDLTSYRRGSYMRLNRDVKERWVRKIYRYCYDNNVVFGCSDPDFKELNMSGSCCALPEVFPENPEICNYVRSQLTDKLRLIRRNYWQGKRGEDILLKFTNVVKGDPKFQDFLFDNKLFRDHIVYKTSYLTAEVSLTTPASCFRSFWNNLRSPNCPMNYFEGKVMPCGKDEDGNLIFEYKEHPYEKFWVEDLGIDLGKY